MLDRLWKRKSTLDQGAQASLPGRLKVNHWKYFSSFPQESWQQFSPLLNWLFCFIVCNAICWTLVETIAKPLSNQSPQTSSILFQILGLRLLVMGTVNLIFIRSLISTYQTVYHWLCGIQDKFLYGCINPAVVVSHSPYLVAVSTDLSVGGESYPVIKILPQPLDKIKSGIPSINTRLATVAVYFGSYSRPHWDDFFPVVIDCVTNDSSDIEQTLARIDREGWADLQDGLRQVKTPLTPGLYFINSDDQSMAQNSPEYLDEELEEALPELVDPRDILQVITQTSNTLELKRGFPTALDSWRFEWSQMKIGLGLKEGLFAILMFLSAIAPFLKIILSSFTSKDPGTQSSSWVIVLILGFSLIGTLLIFFLQPFLEHWKFDRISGKLTHSYHVLGLGRQVTVYPLGQFQNVVLLDDQSSSALGRYALELIKHRPQKRGWFTPKPENVLLGRVASGSALDFKTRIRSAKELQSIIQEFMDWTPQS
jgi:Protein of unknown function (DUF3239)